jgi:hypothetical protein
LVAGAETLATRDQSLNLISVPVPVIVFGVLLSLIWAAVAFSSYAWIKEWRGSLVAIAEAIQQDADTKAEVVRKAFEKPSAQRPWARAMWGTDQQAE